MNNRNDFLSDVLETFQHDQGCLTELDRTISENEIETIRSSAWSPEEFPIVKTEEAFITEHLKNNNYVDVQRNIQQQNDFKNTKSFHTMSRRGRSLSSEVRRLPKRQCTMRQSLNEDRAPPIRDLHYMYQDELALGMNQMTVSQKDISERDDEEEYEASSGSSSPASSSSSEYQPESSSRFDNNANPPELPQERRRLRKKQKMQMTKEQLEARRKEANKKNSKTYNENKKRREANLLDELNAKKVMVATMSDSNSAAEAELLECYVYIKRYMEIPLSDVFYMTEDVYKTKRHDIDVHFNSFKRSDNALKKLYQNLHQRKRSFDTASKDIKTKRAKTNTYGSRKSRALHSMNIAKYEYKVADLEYQVRKQNEWTSLINFTKGELSKVFTWGNVPESKYEQMSPEAKGQIDWLIGFLMF